MPFSLRGAGGSGETNPGVVDSKGRPKIRGLDGVMHLQPTSGKGQGGDLLVSQLAGLPTGEDAGPTLGVVQGPGLWPAHFEDSRGVVAILGK